MCRSSKLLQLLTAVIVQVLGRLHEKPIRARQPQASEKRQGTKVRHPSRVISVYSKPSVLPNLDFGTERRPITFSTF
jgi:hypothetical protein